jgi:hypothetical protein
MGPSHGPWIPQTWCLQTFSCGGMSSHLCTDKDHRMKLTSDRSLRKCYVPRGATSPRGMKYAASAVAIMLSVNILMCWDTKVESLLHVYVPLTGNEVDSFLQRFHFFLWHLKWITCILDNINKTSYTHRARYETWNHWYKISRYNRWNWYWSNTLGLYSGSIWFEFLQFYFHWPSSVFSGESWDIFSN